MKKIKISLVAIAFVLGIASAIGTKAAASKDDTNYYWFDSNNVEVGFGTRDSQLPNCSGASIVCENGYENEDQSGLEATPILKAN
jgi:hypothetical protein